MRSAMIRHSTERHSSERGAVLVQVSIALLGLMAFSAFVMDYGILWASRGQAQTSADAGALAGAMSLGFADSDDFAAAQEKAQAVSLQNGVWGEDPDVLLSDITFLPPSVCKPPEYPGVADTCVKVDVFRNQRAGG